MVNSQNISFLTYCSKTVIDQKDIEKIRSLVGSGLDWPAIVTKAQIQGVAQFLYFHLSKLEDIWATIPEDSKDELKQSYFIVLSSNWLMQIELEKVITVLNRASIEAIVLKGASLLETVYKNIAFRRMSDVDLLVKKNDLSRVKNILSESGYQKPDFLDQDSLEKFGGEVHLYKNGGVFLDIHTTLSQYERFGTVFKIDRDEEIWTKSRKFKSGSGEIRMLGPNHLLIHLCMHQAIAHGFAGLFRFCDLRQTILTYEQELDWRYLISKAERYKIKKIIYYSLNFMQELFGQILPKEILQALKPNRARSILSDFFVSKEKILSLPDEEPKAKKPILQLFLMDNFLDLPKIIFKGLFPSNEWLKYRYGIHKKIELIFYRVFHPFITMSNILS